MKLLLYLLLLCLCGCAAARPATTEELTYTKVIELPAQSKAVIYEKSRQWVAKTFKSAKAVVEYENKDEGVIIGNGLIARAPSSINPFGGGLISFQLREDIKDGKARLLFDRLIALGTPNVYSSTGEFPVLVADIEATKLSFEGMAQDLQSFVLQGQGNNW